MIRWGSITISMCPHYVMFLLKITNILMKPLEVQVTQDRVGE